MTPLVAGTAAALGTAALVVLFDDVRWSLAARRSQHRPAVVTGAGPAPRAGFALPSRLRRACEQAGVPDAERAVAVYVGAVSLAAALAVVSPGGRILLAVALVGPPAALHVARGRLARQRAAQLPEALDAVAAGLRGGLGLAGAIAGARAVGPPLGPELAGIGRQVDAGRPLDEALSRWRSDHPDPATGLAVASLGVAATVGGPGARAIDGAAASLRDRHASEAEAGALAAQAKASAVLLTATPVVFAVLLTSVDPTAGRFLLGTPLGWACIAIGLTLDLVGAAWMAALMRRGR